jgi:hypothetical protein
MTLLEAHHLVPWEEGALKLRNLAEDDGCLVASGGKVRLCLPLHMKVELANYVGLRISILRTDIGYRVRLLDEKL